MCIAISLLAIITYVLTPYISANTLIYETDLSEFCMRQQSMSMMLGRHTTFSSSTAVQLNRLDVPYSCYMIVRTEAGNNLILVVQTDDLVEPCVQHNDQLLVYGMEETFGGYRGMWEGAYTNVDPKKLRTKFYTTRVPATAAPTMRSETRPRYSTQWNNNKLKKQNQSKFDTMYDVAPRPGEEFAYTTVFPLVKFSFMPEGNVEIDGERRYQFDYRINDEFFMKSSTKRHDKHSKRPFHELTKTNSLIGNHNLRNNKLQKTERITDPYDYSIVPLVRFSLMKEEKSKIDGERRYQFDYSINDDIFSSLSSKRYRNNKYTRRPFIELISTTSDFGQQNWRRNRIQKSKRRQYKRPTFIQNHRSIDSNDLLLSSDKSNGDNNGLKTSTESTYAWDSVLDLIKKINDSVVGSLQKTTNVPYNEAENILSNRRHMIKQDGVSSKSTKPLPFSQIRLNRFTKTPLKFTQGYLKKFSFNIKDVAITSISNVTSFIVKISSDVNKNRTVLDNTPRISYSNFEATRMLIKEVILQTETVNIQSVTNQIPSLKTDNLRPFIDNSGNIKRTTPTSTKDIENHAELSLEPTLLTKAQLSIITKTNEKLNLLDQTGDFTTSSFFKTQFKKNASTPLQTKLVGRESWENVVQVAPKIAMLLNHTTEQNIDSEKTNLTNKNIRKKRYVESIPLMNAPHHFTTTELDTPTLSTIYNGYFGYNNGVYYRDEFMKMTENQKDETYGRVNLLDWREHVGPMIFNICEHHTIRPNVRYRRIIMFNSSRIVISVNDFMINNLMIILTTATTLKSMESMCPMSHVECQVNGVRVCIEASCACDGIPNCGSYEIYDEDLLRCNIFSLYQHNLVLAACTFLIVLLTVLYSIHYWLKRCVPRVSQAFFVYTDSGDNILYLKSIMRSPLEPENSTTSFNPDKFYDDILYDAPMEKKKNCVISFCQKYFSCFRQNLKVELYDDEIEKEKKLKLQRTYSFTETELKRMAESRATSTEHTDATVQTGPSLEMTPLDTIRLQGCTKQTGNPTADDNSNFSIDNFKETELSLIKKLKDEYSILSLDTSIVMSDTTTASKNVIFNESELQDINYSNFQYNADTGSTRRDMSSMLPSCSYDAKRAHPPKRIRFVSLEKPTGARNPREHSILDLNRGVELEKATEQHFGRRIWSNLKGNRKGFKKGNAHK